MQGMPLFFSIFHDKQNLRKDLAFNSLCENATISVQQHVFTVPLAIILDTVLSSRK